MKNELRIGNWIESHEAGRTRVNGHLLAFLETPKSLVTGFVDPILITEKILKKCGFKKNTDSNWGKLSISDNNDYFIMMDISFKERIDDTYLVQFGSGGIMPPCKYLHQLQNLYYALTGSELEVNW